MFSEPRAPGISEGNSKLGEHSSKGRAGSSILTEHCTFSSVKYYDKQHKELAENISIFIVDYS